MIFNNPRFIIIDGPDGSGKTTLAEKFVQAGAKMFKYPKRLSNGDLFRMNTESHFEILRMTLPYFEHGIYVTDRFYLSNCVYDKIFRDEDISASLAFREWIKDNLDVMEIILTRPKIEEDFEDDLIKMPKDTFNSIIDEYKKYGRNYDIINNQKDSDDLLDSIGEFIRE